MNTRHLFFQRGLGPLRHIAWAAGFSLALGASCAAQSVTPPATPEAAPSHLYVYLGLGGFQPVPNAQLSQQHGRYSMAFGAGWRVTPRVALEVDLSTYQQRLDTPAGVSAPPFGSVEPRSTLSSSGLAGQARYSQPIGPVQLHAGLGAGVYTVRLLASGQQLGLPTQVIRDDRGRLGWQASAGLLVPLSKQFELGLAYRRLHLQASLDGVVPGRLEAGGSAWLLLLRFTP